MRIAALTLLGLPAVLALLVFGLLAAAHTAAGERWIAGRLEAAMGTPEAPVRIADLDLTWPLDLRIGALGLSDGAGEWLTVSDLSLDWSPARLLTGVFAADHLEMGRVYLARPPHASDKPDEPANGALIPRLPVAVDIRSLSAELATAEAVTGSPARLLLAGHARAAEDSADIRLDLRHAAEATDAGRVVLGFDRGTGQIVLDLETDEALGAVLTRLAGLGEMPPLAFRVTGTGPLSNWNGAVLASAGGRSCVDAELRLSAQDQLALRVAGEAVAACLPQAADLGGSIRFRADAQLEHDTIRIGEAELASTLGTITFSGTITGEAISGRFGVDTPDLAQLARQPGLEGRASLSGTVLGTLAAPVIEADLRSPHGGAYGFAWRDMQARLGVRRLDGGAWLVGTNAALDATEGAPPALLGPTTLAVTATIQDGGVIRIANLRLANGTAALSLLGSVKEAGRDTALHGILTAPRLSAVSDTVDGAAVLRFSARGDLLGPDLRIGIVGRSTNLALGTPQVDALLGRAPRLSAAATVGPRGLPRIVARLNGAGGSLRLAGQVGGDGLALGWRAAIPDLAVVPDQNLAGSADASGILLGPTDAPHLAASLRADIRTPALGAPATLVASVSLRDLAATPTGTIAAALDARGRRVDLVTRYRVGDEIALQDMRATSGKDRVTGNLALRGDGVVDGTLAGEVADLGRWSDLAGMPLSGQVSFDAALTAAEGQGLRAGLRGRAVRIGDNNFGAVRGDARLTALFTAPAGDIRVSAENMVVGGQALSRVTMTGKGAGQGIDFTVDARGDGANLDAAGTWVPRAGEQEVRLATLRLRSGTLTGRLTEPTRAVLSEAGDLLVAPTTLDLGRGRLAFGGTLRDGRIDARLQADRLPLALAAVFLDDERAQGVISGDVRLGGTLDRPEAVARFDGRDVAFGATGSERMDVRLDARWADGVVRLDMEARDGRAASVALDASFPLRVENGLTVPPNGALRGTLVADGDLARITDLLPLSGHRFAGKLHADVTVAGTVGTPLVDGEARLDDGYYQFFDTGTVIRNLEARLVAQDSRTFELRLRGDDGRRGRVGAQGTILSGEGLAYDVAVDMRDFRLIDLDAGTAQGSGKLTLSGRNDAAALSGRIDIGPAEYDLAGALPGGAVPTIEVVEINKPGAPQYAALPDPRREAAIDEGPPATPFTVALDIQANVERLFVRGQGLESVWGGTVMVRGTAAEPVLTGAIRAVRGTYDFVGRRFELADSSVVFEGSPIPRLDAVAEAQARDMTAQVRVTGDATSPRFDFTSDPVYPKDEILSRLLFGREVGQLSVAQQIQIARAAASLAGGGSGFDPIGSLRRGLGLDMLELGAGDMEDGGLSPSVSVGKYLDDDTFLRVEEGGKEGGEVSIERQIGRGLSVEAEVGRRGSGGLGLSWRRDY